MERKGAAVRKILAQSRQSASKVRRWGRLVNPRRGGLGLPPPPSGAHYGFAYPAKLVASLAGRTLYRQVLEDLGNGAGRKKAAMNLAIYLGSTNSRTLMSRPGIGTER